MKIQYPGLLLSLLLVFSVLFTGFSIYTGMLWALWIAVPITICHLGVLFGNTQAAQILFVAYIIGGGLFSINIFMSLITDSFHWRPVIKLLFNLIVLYELHSWIENNKKDLKSVDNIV